jgi:hypothetical protein
LLMEIMNLSKEVPPKKHQILKQKMKIRLNSKQNLLLQSVKRLLLQILDHRKLSMDSRRNKILAAHLQDYFANRLLRNIQSN